MPEVMEHEPTNRARRHRRWRWVAASALSAIVAAGLGLGVAEDIGAQRALTGVQAQVVDLQGQLRKAQSENAALSSELASPGRPATAQPKAVSGSSAEASLVFQMTGDGDINRSSSTVVAVALTGTYQATYAMPGCASSAGSVGFDLVKGGTSQDVAFGPRESGSLEGTTLLSLTTGSWDLTGGGACKWTVSIISS